VKDMLRHYYLRYAGPAGMTEQDDMENWTSVQRSLERDSRPPLPAELRNGHRKGAAWVAI
ncbi:MAG TPA: hypothetical protein VMW62_19115, partial [Chloroflexota bacterium]|nr:hypothetical protein [Chloroflexota bacterium]